MARGRNLRFRLSESERAKTTQDQLKDIHSLYGRAAEDLRKKIKKMESDPNATKRDIMQTKVLKDLEKQIMLDMEGIGREIETGIKSSIERVAQSVVDENNEFMFAHGMASAKRAFSHVPQDIVETIVTGQLYESDWTLSHAIWSADKKIHKQVHDIVSVGVIGNKSALEVAQDLEKYVTPEYQSQRSRKIFYKDKNGKQRTFYFGDVSYSAQRLARTMITHAYQEAFVRTTRKNPFFDYYIWRASGSRVCPICQARDGEKYKKDELPLDHPNGMCVWEAHQSMSDDEMIETIAKWKPGSGNNPELDEYARDAGII